MSANVQAIIQKWGGGASAQGDSNVDAIVQKWGGASAPQPDKGYISKAWDWLNADNPTMEKFAQDHPTLAAPLRFANAAGAAAEGLPKAAYEQLAHPKESAKQMGEQVAPLREDIRNYEAEHPEYSGLGAAAILPAIGHEFYEGYKGGVLPEALGTGTGTVLGGEAMGRVTGPLKRMAGEAITKVPAVGEFAKSLSKPAIAAKASPGLEAAGNEVRGQLESALQTHEQSVLDNLSRDPKTAQQQLADLDKLRNTVTQVSKDSNARSLFDKYNSPKLAPEFRNAVDFLSEKGLLDKGRIDQLAESARKISSAESGGYAPWIKRAMFGYVPARVGMEVLQQAGVLPKATGVAGLLPYAVGMGGYTLADMLHTRLGALRAIKELPELERPTEIVREPPAPPPPPPPRPIGTPIPISEGARLRQSVPLELQPVPGERPFENMLREVESETRSPRGGAENEAKLRTELEKSGQAARERARTQEAMRHTAEQVEAAAPGVAEKTALPEDLRGSIPKPSGRLVLSPEEARSQERMERIAGERARKHGTMYAAGMRPEGGGRVPLTPTGIKTEEYGGPREVIKFGEGEGILPKVKKMEPRLRADVRRALRRLSPAADD